MAPDSRTPDEPMLPQSMHDRAVEAAREFGRQEAERNAMQTLGVIVMAAGGEVRVTRRALMDDYELTVHEDYRTGEYVYRVREAQDGS